MERYDQEYANAEDYALKSGVQQWRCPSNIALIKYWGKYGDQLPRNPSLSFTLNNAHTTTKLIYSPAQDPGNLKRTFRFEGKEVPKFSSRVMAFLDRVVTIFPFLLRFDLDIESENSFPHSSGIASSASAMCALAMCVCSMEQDLSPDPIDRSAFWEKASFIARLGSGSACRSIFPRMAMWGFEDHIEMSSDFYAIPMASHLHASMTGMRDSILIISSEEKAISSRDGHALMEQHNYASTRYRQARKHLLILLDAIEKGDFESFGAIVEKEALELHALMMCSDPPYILLMPETIAVIHAIWAWRAKEKLPVYFTLDAGPNVHLLYPHSVESQVKAWIDASLSEHIVSVIHDRLGEGPQQL